MAQGTEQFAGVIERYLDHYSASDVEFAEKYYNPQKTIEQCVNYIIACVEKAGRCGFADEEIYALAREYYEIENYNQNGFVSPSECKIIINEKIELTQEEKDEARARAKVLFQERLIDEMESERMKKQAKKAKAEDKENTVEQPSLF